MVGRARVTFRTALPDTERTGWMLGLYAVPIFITYEAGQVFIRDSVTIIVDWIVFVAHLVDGIANDRVTTKPSPADYIAIGLPSAATGPQAQRPSRNGALRSPSRYPSSMTPLQLLSFPSQISSDSSASAGA